MSIQTFSARELALVAVRFGARPADLALVSEAHAAAFEAWYGRCAEASTTEEIKAAVAGLRAPLVGGDAQNALSIQGLLDYNARIPSRDWTAEEPWAGAFERIGKAVLRTLRRELRDLNARRPS